MKGNTYNGWTNWETWNANLWLDDMLDHMHNDGEEITAGYVQQLIDEMVSAATEEGANGLITDLLSGAVREINFREIASRYQSEE